MKWGLRPVAVGILTAALIAPPASGQSTATATPVADLAFDAIPRIADVVPADPAGSAGSDRIVTAVNVHYAVFTEGGTRLLGDDPLEDLFRFPNGTQIFDPKVVYDHFSGNHVLAFLAVNENRERSWILLAVIPDQTASVPATWCLRKFNGDQERGRGALWADYPGLGFDRHWVYLATNQFDFGSQPEFRYAQIMALKKTRLYDCGDEPLVRVFNRGQTVNPNGSQAFTIQPAITESLVDRDRPEYLVSFTENQSGGSGNSLTLWRIRFQGGGRLHLTRRAVDVGRAIVARFGTQRGGNLNAQGTWWDTGDLRLTTAFYDADLDRVFTAHAVEKNLGGSGYVESTIRWYELDPSPFGSSNARRKGFVGRADTDAGWPAVATDSAGNLFVTYSRGSAVPGAQEYLSAWVATLAPGQQNATGNASNLLVRAGQSRFEFGSGPERWGDYNAAGRDPDDPSAVWLFNQFATGLGATTDVWQQVVGRTRVQP